MAYWKSNLFSWGDMHHETVCEPSFHYENLWDARGPQPHTGLPICRLPFYICSAWCVVRGTGFVKVDLGSVEVWTIRNHPQIRSESVNSWDVSLKLTTKTLKINGKMKFVFWGSGLFSGDLAVSFRECRAIKKIKKESRFWDMHSSRTLECEKIRMVFQNPKNKSAQRTGIFDLSICFDNPSTQLDAKISSKKSWWFLKVPNLSLENLGWFLQMVLLNGIVR